ncbi:MAG: DNA recombination protein RmuC [Longimicrobiales bacterium]
MLWIQLVPAFLLGALLAGIIVHLRCSHARATAERELADARARLDAERLHAAEKASLDAVLRPLADTIARVDRKLEDVEQARREAYGTLRGHLDTLRDSQLRLHSETSNLVKALRAPNVRGRWGEIQLQRVVELAGMVEHCDFVQQATLVGADGRRRPDLIVRLPGGKRVVVDSKAPLQHYLDALEASDDDVRRARLADHARAIRRLMQDLASKSYWERLDETPEFVILFIPGEAFYSAALEQDPALIEFGPEQRVLLATPTTLIALLKAVAYGWRQERIADNAREISDLGRELYLRLRTLAQHVQGIGRNLDRAVESYNSVIGTLESRVLVSARRFHELGAAPADDLGAPEPVDRRSRAIQADELLRV